VPFEGPVRLTRRHRHIRRFVRGAPGAAINARTIDTSGPAYQVKICTGAKYPPTFFASFARREDKAPDDACHIVGVINRLQAGRHGDRGDLRLLTCANLDKGAATRRQPIGNARHHTPPAGKPVIPAIKRK
jgi:hypothetical protein